MDVKGICNSDLFREDPVKCHLWSRQMRSFYDVVSRSLVTMMKTAQQSTAKIITARAEERHMSAQLHLIVVGVLREELLNMVINAPDNHGFEA